MVWSWRTALAFSSMTIFLRVMIVEVSSDPNVFYPGMQRTRVKSNEECRSLPHQGTMVPSPYMMRRNVATEMQSFVIDLRFCCVLCARFSQKSVK